jgi:hypothetical protein
MIELLRSEMLNAERLIRHFIEMRAGHVDIEELKRL